MTRCKALNPDTDERCAMPIRNKHLEHVTKRGLRWEEKAEHKPKVRKEFRINLKGIRAWRRRTITLPRFGRGR